ncbi:MAG: hypothetical protein IKF99_09855 [Oscillospiraceae bacterium]|nr:hypothetical protein [Oscillospiraceae bacterium]
MRIKITEIEASADELRASNSIADGILRILKNCLSPDCSGSLDDEEEADSE